MENIDDFYRNGSPYYRGRCPECGEENGDCYNGPCKSCSPNVMKKCPECGDWVRTGDFHETGVCIFCFEFEPETEQKAVEFAERFKSNI